MKRREEKKHTMTNHIFVFGLRFLIFYLQLSDDLGYVLYSALGSFYIPSCIMVFVYIRIYFAAKARARRGIKKKPLKSTQEQVILILCIFVLYGMRYLCVLRSFFILSFKWMKPNKVEQIRMERNGTKSKKNDEPRKVKYEWVNDGQKGREFSTKKGEIWRECALY